MNSLEPCRQKQRIYAVPTIELEIIYMRKQYMRNIWHYMKNACKGEGGVN